MANNEAQAAFMEALNGLKEYAAVNGKQVSKEDIYSYFKQIDIDDSKYGIIQGYLMANGIKISGEDISDNVFLNMMEKPETEEIEACEPVKADVDYSEDDKYLKLYLEDLKNLAPLSDLSRAMLLVNIVEDNDKESLKVFSESYLTRIVEWIEEYRYRGVLACDLVAEGNLAMIAYVNEKRFLNNYEWKDRIKEGSTKDLSEVLSMIDEAVKNEVCESIRILLDEQNDMDKVSGKVLGKVNLVNDWGKRIRKQLGRKPTIKEVAEGMGVSEDIVREAITLSAETIEDISYEKTIEK